MAKVVSVIPAKPVQLIRGLPIESKKRVCAIAKGLTADRIPISTGRTVWHESVLKKMLQNEKYAGDALLQKTVTTDFLTRKRVVNSGHAQQHYVEDSHPAIMPKETFQAVQAEIERRSRLMGGDKNRSRYTNQYPFSGKIFCGQCGEPFRRKYWGTGKYKKAVWQCRTRTEKGSKGCGIPAVDEEKLQAAFARVLGRLVADRESLVKRMTENIEKVFRGQAGKVDLTALDARVEELRAEMAALVKLNLTKGIDKEIYDDEYRRITSEIDELRTSRAGVTRAELARQETIGRIRDIAKVLREADAAREWDEELFAMFVERIRVVSMVQVEFVLKSGVGITEIM